MEMENKILKAIENLGVKIENLDVRFDKFEARFDKLETRFDKFEIQVDQRFDAVDQRFDAVDQRFDILESQTKENTEMIRSLIHSADVNKAEHDRLLINIMHIQGDTTHIKKDLSIVELVTANNYTDLARLKAVR